MNVSFDQTSLSSYTPGDVLELRPHNDPLEVQRFIETLGWEEDADRVSIWSGKDNGTNYNESSPPFLLGVLLISRDLLENLNSASVAIPLPVTLTRDTSVNLDDRTRHFFGAEGRSLRVAVLLRFTISIDFGSLRTCDR